MVQKLLQGVNTFHRTEWLHSVNHLLSGCLMRIYWDFRLSSNFNSLQIGIILRNKIKILNYYHLFEEISSERVASSKLEGAAIHLQFISNIEIINGIEFIVIWWWQWDSMTSDERS